jgi:hypothetical protein
MRFTLVGGPHDGIAGVHHTDLPPGYVPGNDETGTLFKAFYFGESPLSRPCRSCGHYGAEHDIACNYDWYIPDFDPGPCYRCDCERFRDPAARRIA